MWILRGWCSYLLVGAAFLWFASYSLGLNCCAKGCCRQSQYIIFTKVKGPCFAYPSPTCYDQSKQTGSISFYTPTGDGGTKCNSVDVNNAEYNCTCTINSCAVPLFPSADATNPNGFLPMGCMLTGANPLIYECMTK